MQLTQEPVHYGTFFQSGKPRRRCCHLPMSITLSVSILGAATAACGIFMISKTLAAGAALANPMFLIGLGMVAAGLILGIGIWQFYLWQSKRHNAIFDADPLPESSTVQHTPT